MPPIREDTVCPGGSICVAFVLGACTSQRGPFALPCGHYHWSPSEELQYRLNGEVPRKGQALRQLKQWHLIVDEVLREGKVTVSNMNRGRHSRGRDRSEKRDEHKERRVSERGGRRRERDRVLSESPERKADRGRRNQKRDRSLSKSPERIADRGRHETRRSAYPQRSGRVSERSRGRSPSRQEKRTRFEKDERAEEQARGHKKRGRESEPSSRDDGRRKEARKGEKQGANSQVARSREESKQGQNSHKSEQRKGERERPSDRSRDEHDNSKRSRKRSPSSRSEHRNQHQSLPPLSERHGEKSSREETEIHLEKKQEKVATPKKAAGGKKSAKPKVLSPQRVNIGEGLWIDEAADEAMERPESAHVSTLEASNGGVAIQEEEALQLPMKELNTQEEGNGAEKSGQQETEGTAEMIATADNALGLLQEEYDDAAPMREDGTASAGLPEGGAIERRLEDGSRRDDDGAKAEVRQDEEAIIEQKENEQASADVQKVGGAEGEEGLGMQMAAQEEVPARKEEEAKATEGGNNKVAEAGGDLGAMLGMDAMQMDLATGIEPEPVARSEAGAQPEEQSCQVTPLTGSLEIREGALVKETVDRGSEEGMAADDSVGLDPTEAVCMVEKSVEKESLPSGHNEGIAPQAQLSSPAETPAVTILTAEEKNETGTVGTGGELAPEPMSEAEVPEASHPEGQDVVQEKCALELGSEGLHESMGEANEEAAYTQHVQEKEAGAGEPEAAEELGSFDVPPESSKHAEEGNTDEELVLDEEPSAAQQVTLAEETTAEPGKLLGVSAMLTAVDASGREGKKAGGVPEWISMLLTRGWEKSCRTHPRSQLRLVCVDCAHVPGRERPVCKDCFEGDHEDHDVRTLRCQDNDWLLLERKPGKSFDFSDLPKRRTKLGNGPGLGVKVWKPRPFSGGKPLPSFVCGTCGAKTKCLGNEEAAFCSLECKANCPAGIGLRGKASTPPTSLAESVAGSDPASVVQKRKSKQQKKGKGRASAEPRPSLRDGLRNQPPESTAAAVELLVGTRALAASETAGRTRMTGVGGAVAEEAVHTESLDAGAVELASLLDEEEAEPSAERSGQNIVVGMSRGQSADRKRKERSDQQASERQEGASEQASGAELDGQTEDSRTGPPWLSALLTGPFFTDCEAHAKSNKNKFCTDCALGCCPICLSEEHEGHQAFQIRKSSYRNSVRVADVKELVDLDDVQLYVFNKAKVVFLNGKPPSRSMKGIACEICGHLLVDKVRTCSLGCKLLAIQAHPEDSALNLQAKQGPSFRDMGLQVPQKGEGASQAEKQKAGKGAAEEAPSCRLEEERQTKKLKMRSLQAIQESSPIERQERPQGTKIPRELRVLFDSGESKLEGEGARKSRRRSEAQQQTDVRERKNERGGKRQASQEAKGHRELEAAGKRGRKGLEVDAMDVEEAVGRSAEPLPGKTSKSAEPAKKKALKGGVLLHIDLEHDIPPEVLEAAQMQVSSRQPISATQYEPAPQRTSKNRHVKEVELLSPPEKELEPLLTTSGRPMRRSAETAKQRIAQDLLSEGGYERRAELAKQPAASLMMTPGGSLAGPEAGAQTMAHRMVTPGEALALQRAPPGQVWVWVPASGSAEQWSYSRTWEGASGRAAIAVPITSVVAPVVQPPPQKSSGTAGISSAITQTPAAFASVHAPPSASTQAAAECLETLGAAAPRPKAVQEAKRLQSDQDGGVLALGAPRRRDSASPPRVSKSRANVPAGPQELEWGGTRVTRSAALPTATAEVPAGTQAGAAVSGIPAPKVAPRLLPNPKLCAAPAAELAPRGALPPGTKIVGPLERIDVAQTLKSISAPAIASGGLGAKSGHVPEVRKGPQEKEAATREAGIQASAVTHSAARAPQSGLLAPPLPVPAERFVEPQTRRPRTAEKRHKPPKEQPAKSETKRRIGRPPKKLISVNEPADVASPGSDVIATSAQQQAGRTKRRKTAGADVSKEVQTKTASADVSKKVQRPKKGALQQKQAAGRSMSARGSELAVVPGMSELGIESGAPITKQAKARKGFAVERIKTGQFWEESSSDSDSEGGEEEEDEEPPEELMKICQVFKDIWTKRERLTKTVMYIHYLKGVTMTKEYLSKSGVDDLVQKLMKFDHEWVSVAAAQLWEQWQPILKER